MPKHNQKLIITYLIISCIASLPLSFPSKAYADNLIYLPPRCPNGLETALGCIPVNLPQALRFIFSLSLSVGGGISFLLMILGALQILTSTSNPDQLKEGRERFTSAIIGLVLIVFSTLVYRTIAKDMLQIPNFN